MKKLKYGWVDYSKDYREIVESFLDDEAIKSTGCDDGFEAFYTYWMSEEDTRLNENFWFKVISTDQKPIAIIAIAKSQQNEFTVSEFIIAPTERRKGHGKAILKELGIEGDFEGVGNCIVGYADVTPEVKPRKANRVYYID